MSTLAIFFVGLFVTTMTAVAVFLIGLSEASDPVHSRYSDLTSIERALVDRSPDEEERPSQPQ
jgi:hypothetical protein